MRPEPTGWVGPDWPDLPQVRALMSTRRSGGEGIDYDLAAGAAAFMVHEQALASALGAQPRWLRQVHGATVVRLDERPAAERPEADASVTARPGVACVVRVADCLPVLLAHERGQAVGAAHAGWRGLAAGVLEHTLQALCREAGCAPSALRAWLGPCIGPRAFEVGEDVLLAFGRDPAVTDDDRFRRADRADGSRRWRADLPALARDRLGTAGVGRVDGGHWCTVEDASAFFSFRRDRSAGRMAAAIVRVG
ncbi:MAG: peptidoglycan editing factor PgeF [Rubrivivax sp.]